MCCEGKSALARRSGDVTFLLLSEQRRSSTPVNISHLIIFSGLQTHLNLHQQRAERAFTRPCLGENTQLPGWTCKSQHGEETEAGNASLARGWGGVINRRRGIVSARM